MYIRILENNDWIVDYDIENNQYRVNYFQDNHFVGEVWFDAYKVTNKQLIIYDMDRVIEQLEGKSAAYCNEYGYAENENILYLPDAIEIVKKGGAE